MNRKNSPGRKFGVFALATMLSTGALFNASEVFASDEQSKTAARALCNQALFHLQSQQFEQAFQAYDKAMAVCNDDATIFYTAGVAHQNYAYMPGANSLDELRKAESLFQKAFSLKTDQVEILAHLANVQAELNKNAESLANLERILRLPNLEEQAKMQAQQAMQMLKAKMASQGQNIGGQGQSAAGQNQSTATQSQSTPTQVQNIAAPTASAGQSLIQYSDANFSIKIPEGWKASSDQNTGAIDAGSPDGISISITPFFTPKKLVGSEANNFFNSFISVFAPSEKWSTPTAAGPNSLRATYSNQSEDAIAAVVLNPQANGTNGNVCVVRIPKAAKNIGMDLIAQIIASVQYSERARSAPAYTPGTATTDNSNSAANNSTNIASNDADESASDSAASQNGSASENSEDAGTQDQSAMSMPAPEMTNAPPQPSFTSYQLFRDPDQNSFSVEVPAGWKVEGGMVRRVSIDARPWVKTTSPDGLITAFIGDAKIPPYTMPTATLTALGFYQGRYTNGSEIRSYIPARRYVELYAMKYMKPYFKNIQVVAGFDHPDVARAINGTVGVTRSEAHSIKLTAMYGNLPAVAYYLASTKATVAYGTGMWWVSLIAGEVSPADRDAEGLSVILHMIQTWKWNPQWTGQAIAAAGETSRQYTASSQLISKSISDRYWSQQAANDRFNSAYWNRQASQDRAAYNFSDAIRGVEQVQDPNTGNKYQVEYGPRYHWINQQGYTTGTDYSSPGQEWTQLLSVPR